tara:strand:- start:49 stop:159 length:111 start_codon:yes stop_codon:yes gene_type:complete
METLLVVHLQVVLQVEDVVLLMLQLVQVLEVVEMDL